MLQIDLDHLDREGLRTLPHHLAHLDPEGVALSDLYANPWRVRHGDLLAPSQETLALV
jgi:hypothetical protein